MTLPLDHVGLAIREPLAVLEMLDSLIGLQTYAQEDVEQQGVRTYLISAGAAKLELLEGLTKDSPVSRFLAKRGEGMHHMAFEVPDIGVCMRRVRKAGFVPLTEEPVPGADGKLIFFLHPADTHGVLIEFCQSARQECVVVVHAADEVCPTPALGSRYRVHGLAVSRAKDVKAALANEPAHVVTTGLPASWAMEFARNSPRRLLSLVLHNPAAFPAYDLRRVFLICSTGLPVDQERIQAAHRAIRGSRIAVLPRENGLESRVVARLLEQFFRLAMRGRIPV